MTEQGPSATAVVVLEERAFLNLVLHSLKFPLAAVNGVLVGSRSSESVLVSRVAPMIHTHTYLPGQLDVALALLDERLKELNEKDNTTLEIVGYYQVNERRDDVELGAVEKRIADGVGSTALVLDADALAALESKDMKTPKPCFALYTKKGSSWNKANAETALRIPCLADEGSTRDTMARLRQSVAENFGGVQDFEEHMEDVRVEFLH